MSEAGIEPGRVGRPPKIDEHGTPTRERLLRAAVEACVEYGYDGATLADIARRAGVSTPAVYSHFSGKAALLVEASKHELDAIAAIRQPEVAELLGHWQRENAERLERLAGLGAGQVRLYYLLLVGLSYADQVDSLDVAQDEFERQIGALIDEWFRHDRT